MSTRVQKVMLQPIHIIFRFLQQKTPVQIWLYDHADLRIEGKIIGFDEFMNLVIDDAREVSTKKKAVAAASGDGYEEVGAYSTPLGRIMLKGDNISLIQPIAQAA